MKKEFIVLNRVAQAVFDKKGINILALDIRPCTDTTDYVIIAEGLALRSPEAEGASLSVKKSALASLL